MKCFSAQRRKRLRPRRPLRLHQHRNLQVAYQAQSTSYGIIGPKQVISRPNLSTRMRARVYSSKQWTKIRSQVSQESISLLWLLLPPQNRSLVSSPHSTNQRTCSRWVTLKGFSTFSIPFNQHPRAIYYYLKVLNPKIPSFRLVFVCVPDEDILFAT